MKSKPDGATQRRALGPKISAEIFLPIDPLIGPVNKNAASAERAWMTCGRLSVGSADLTWAQCVGRWTLRAPLCPYWAAGLHAWLGILFPVACTTHKLIARKSCASAQSPLTPRAGWPPFVAALFNSFHFKFYWSTLHLQACNCNVLRMRSPLLLTSALPLPVQPHCIAALSLDRKLVLCLASSMPSFPWAAHISCQYAPLALPRFVTPARRNWHLIASVDTLKNECVRVCVYLCVVALWLLSVKLWEKFSIGFAIKLCFNMLPSVCLCAAEDIQYRPASAMQ